MAPADPAVAAFAQAADEDGWIRVAREHDVARDGARVVMVADEPVLLVSSDGELYACDARCPHKFGPLEEGTVKDGCITCPVHTATFDLKTGAAGAESRWAGRLRVFAARVRHGFVEIQAPSGP